MRNRFFSPRHRAVLVPVSAAVAALALSACGGSSSSNASAGSTTPGSTTPQRGARGGGFFGAAQDPKVAACLKKQGITLPTGRSRRPGGNGQPPTGTTPGGRPPNGRPGGNSAQFQKLRQALQKCGVQLPAGPPGGGPPPGAAPSTTGTGAS